MQTGIKETNEWRLYQLGLDFTRKLNLSANNDKNERFFAGDQWNGVKSNGLPTPVLNVLKRVGVYKISQILSNEISVKFTVDVDETQMTPESQALIKISDVLSDYINTIEENTKQGILNRRILKDGFITGDGIEYSFFDPNKDTGQLAKGDIVNEIIKNVNYIPGNPNDNRVQPQPYIILGFRQLVAELRKEAAFNNVPQEEIEKIVSDTETENQYGDRAKIELDESGKAICLLYMWKDEKTGTVWFKKSTRYAVVKPEVDTGLKRYQVSVFNWEERENCAYGESEVKSQIPNQISINKLMAAIIKSVMDTAFPKAIYNKEYVKRWTNAIGEAIPFDGDIEPSKVATYLQTGNSSPEVYRLLADLITYTKEMMGANEVALGEVKPENTSAFIAVNQASSVPLEDVQARFYNFIEDLALNWLDLMTTYYGQRNITITKDNVKQIIPVDFNSLKDIQFKIKVDVGPSTKWSEIASIQALDNLLKENRIDFIDYLERIPDGIIPKKQELIEKMKALMEQQAMMQQQQEQAMAQQQAEQQQMNMMQQQMEQQNKSSLENRKLDIQERAVMAKMMGGNR